MTTATRSRIVYLVCWDKFVIGEARDREEAELVRDAHAERKKMPRNVYRIEVELREEGD